MSNPIKVLTNVIKMIETLQQAGLYLTDEGQSILNECKSALSELEKCEPVGIISDLEEVLRHELVYEKGYNWNDKLYTNPPKPREDVQVAYVITDENINGLQVDSIKSLVERCKHAHFTDLHIRINGKWEVYQADWVKHMQLNTKG